MWLKIYILALFSACATRALEISPQRSVFSQAEGSTLQVNCTSQKSVMWSGQNLPVGTVKTVTENANTVSTLTLTDLKKSNEGTYRCEEQGTGVDYTFTLKVFTVAVENATYEYLQDARLHCNVLDSSSTYVYRWRKGDVRVKDIRVEDKQTYTEYENGTLVITHPPRKFAGMYTCVAESGNGSTIEMAVPYYATPKVLPFDKSKNLVQDEKLMVECQVLGYPKPEITWLKGFKPIQIGSDSRYKLSAAKTYDGMSIDNARLEIPSVDFDDAGEYRCVAQHKQWPNFNSSEVILVRVKDKLAALWPFLGIVAEVVILCTIIFIYEKKRNKDAMMDEDSEQDGVAHEKKSENVRHRGNTNNPRA